MFQLSASASVRVKALWHIEDDSLTTPLYQFWKSKGRVASNVGKLLVHHAITLSRSRMFCFAEEAARIIGVIQLHLYL